MLHKDSDEARRQRTRQGTADGKLLIKRYILKSEKSPGNEQAEN